MVASSDPDVLLKEKMKTKPHDIGVIVGRFQIDSLHPAHYDLINNVLQKHDKCLICVGVSPVLGSKEHPLDFPNRSAMIKHQFPDAVIVPILDCDSDYVWSENLDILIRSVFPVGRVCLYGGRDSFLNHYMGKFDGYEFPCVDHRPASDIRSEIGKKIKSSVDFRSGIIYSTQNQYPRVFTTVDIAIINNNLMEETTILLGRKKNQKEFRFPGGFLDQYETLEEAAIREAKEETNLILKEVEYVTSKVIKDWRYEKTSDNIVSAFFLSYLDMQLEGQPKVLAAGDDLEEINFFNLEEKTEKYLRDEHKMFFRELLKKVNNGKPNSSNR